MDTKNGEIFIGIEGSENVGTRTFEPGDIVLYRFPKDLPRGRVGVILAHKDDDTYSILSLSHRIIENRCPLEIFHISEIERFREEITRFYDIQISFLKIGIRKATQREKDEEKAKRYEELQKQILATARNLINYEDESDFENKLCAIAELKKELFSIELTCVSTIRKENGAIKRKIRELEQWKKSELYELRDERIKYNLSVLE